MPPSSTDLPTTSHLCSPQCSAADSLLTIVAPEELLALKRGPGVEEQSEGGHNLNWADKFRFLMKPTIDYPTAQACA